MLAVLFYSSPVFAQGSRFIGSQSCNSTSCHGQTEPRIATGGSRQHEFGLFMQHDPHARAARTLQSTEFQAILNRLSQREDGNADPRIYAKCAQCHDPEGIAFAEQRGQSLVPPHFGQSLVGRGIACEACHGGAKEWLSRHYQRGVSASSLAGLGMLDTENLHARGKLCASCHVGDGERDMNHDMIAAGHPPLRFELTAYHRQLTQHDVATGRQSHWDDSWERIATKDFETKLWSAGQHAVAQSALALLERRAHKAAASPDDQWAGPWPEFAEYDCFGCHQPLRPQTGTGKSLALGFPVWGKWNFALALDAGEAPLLDELRAEMRKAFAPEPQSAETAAAKAHAAASELPVRTDEASVRNLLERLGKPTSDEPTWDRLCHRFLGLAVVEKSIGDEFQKLELRGAAEKSRRGEFNRLRKEVAGELGAIGESLSFADDKREWPRALHAPDGLTRASSALDAAAKKLRTLQGFLEQEQ